MTKAIKITFITIISIISISLISGAIVYFTNPNIQAITDRIIAAIKNDESKLYYFPVKNLDDMSSITYEETVLQIDDKINIYTYKFPSNSLNKKADIFLIHGAGGNISKYLNQIKVLTNAGYEVHTLDWRSFGKSTGIPDYKNVLSDTKKAFELYLNKNDNDSSKTILYGMSLGGQVAIKLASDYKSYIDGLVLDGCVESAQACAIDMAPAGFLKEKAQTNPDNFNQDYVAIRDIAMIKNTPKLIIHSENDKYVPFHRAEKLFASAQHPKLFWKSNSGHIQSLFQQPEESINRINQLYDMID
ncbi:alpha/beta hydrolase [Aureibacter tunicatorum]|uniref:Serine aminopeptidase S33 domain-containing protein n=1 Tax=Aureibacter tunicatorum TaxID=866807 RepID=A0AAE3XNB1_9BACT|nr:alpha/beta fold hydrolase [Aureibacter tunicatorum]MDR6240107.1 hypothetical protein [Aureibacter tunicatorum]BDD06012.1 hypothetical protein AUTU_34950 [Aureibacter tunicatorum]